MKRAGRNNRFKPEKRPITETFGNQDYVAYYKKLLIAQNLTRTEFEDFLQVQSTFRPQFYRISKKANDYNKLVDELKKYIKDLKDEQIEAELIEDFEEQIGICARVFVPQKTFMKNEQIEPYRNWLNQNLHNENLFKL